MLMFFPILIALIFALTEFSLLWAANHTLKAASAAAAREASLPAVSEEARYAAAQQACERVLNDEDTMAAIEMNIDAGLHTGDPVTVDLACPMDAACPDLLAVIGISIKGRNLKAKTVMRRE